VKPSQYRNRWQALQNSTRTQDTSHRWYRMATEDGASSASIDLYGGIGGWFGVEASEFVRELRALDVDELTVHINSPGGDVYDGIAIMNALRQHRATVTVVVDGLAASAASYIAVGAGDEVVMSENSELMIHDAWGFAMGNAADMRTMADDLDRISSNIAGIYATASGTDAAAWREAMLAETWYSAQEAVDAGLADRVAGASDVEDSDEHTTVGPDTSEGDVEDSFDLSVFAHAGRSHAPAPRTPAASASGARTHSSQKGGSAVAFSDEQLTTMRQQLGVASNADEGTILAALTEALSEQASDSTGVSAPEGMALVDSATLDSLREDAAAGRAARDQQQADERVRLVNAAVSDGRIAPARKDHWLAQLSADAGSADTLASLAPGLIPLNEVGHDGEDLAASNNDQVDVKATRASDTYNAWRF